MENSFQLHYSALKNRGRGALNEALQQAVLWLRQTMSQARIGKGRMAVKRHHLEPQE